jgi:protein tyrosine/serine phosphatase
MLNLSNFREIAMGNIASGTLYRSGHPVCDGKQVPDIILSASEAKIKTIINLSDSRRSLGSMFIVCPWYQRMFDGGNVIALNVSMNFGAAEKGFCDKLKKGIRFMTEHAPPYLIHCEAGVDRTGFLSIILEAFMGAQLEDITRDYMLSFVDTGEYSINESGYGRAFMINLFSEIKDKPLDSNEDLRILAGKYLGGKIGLKSDEMKDLANKLNGSFYGL